MADNIIRIMCPNLRCRAILAVPSEARGRLVRCKACTSNIRIPQKVEQPPAAGKGGDQIDVDAAAAADKKAKKRTSEAA